ncbi:hypothetical protein ITJ86_01950 [Winogradskyella sp. F6397]|uniref:Lipoprotein n=1 Tax=Winogradskyella marina TaxID=2785530 RepID=A0ABS0EDX9_9FLAO|nr:hypothetical protein [Winogradskyella marina]MBF8148639.1 hypothetical protein [Winogradskyella marina]
MKNTLSLILLILLCFTSCESKAKYTDYEESDFYEVQGVIISAVQNDNYFDSSLVKNISFNYFLDREIPKTGIEKNLEIFEAKKGYPLIVLVHKENENISFYGRVGILDSINEKEKVFLSKHFQEEIEKLN